MLLAQYIPANSRAGQGQHERATWNCMPFTATINEHINVLWNRKTPPQCCDGCMLQWVPPSLETGAVPWLSPGLAMNNAYSDFQNTSYRKLFAVFRGPGNMNMPQEHRTNIIPFFTDTELTKHGFRHGGRWVGRTRMA